MGVEVAAGGEVATDSASKLAVGGAAFHAHASVEPIFPPELKGRAAPPLCIPGPKATWHRRESSHLRNGLAFHARVAADDLFLLPGRRLSAVCLTLRQCTRRPSWWLGTQRLALR